MELLLSAPAFAVFAIAVMAGIVFLRRTRLYWLPPLAIVGYGVAIFVAWPWYDTHDGHGFEGLSNAMHVGTSFVVVVAGVIALIVMARRR